MAVNISTSFNELLLALYKGPLEEKPWLTFLRLLRTTLNANYSTLLLRPPSQRDSGVVLNAEIASNDAYDSYNERYFAVDPFVNLPHGKAFTLDEIIDESEFFVSDYYTDYMSKVDVFHILGVDLETGSGFSVRLRITRDKTQPNFDSVDKEICEALVEHLENAIELHSRLKSVENERHIYEHAMDELAVGSIILDKHYQIIHSNSYADFLLDAHPEITIKDRRLILANHTEHEKLKSLLEEVHRAHELGEPSVIKGFRYGHIESEYSLGFIIKPMAKPAASANLADPVMVIFLSNPHQPRSPSADILSELFGFTRAESTLALLLVNGLSLAEVADELGISRNTAKSHLSAIFSKTGVSRQPKLVQLILKSVASFGTKSD